MNARSGGLFVGRLAAESGIATLAEALDLYPGARVNALPVIASGIGRLAEIVEPGRSGLLFEPVGLSETVRRATQSGSRLAGET